MSAWQKEELVKIATTDDLHISPFRDDGRTYGTPTWIWSVVLDDELYVRVYNGQNSRWYQAALRQKGGRITATGMTVDVIFEPVDGPAFTGTVRIDPLLTAPDPALVSVASVTFEPGARISWHTHPLGQTLIVTAGCGWAIGWDT